MRCLIVDDDLVSIKVLEGMMSRFATNDVVFNGQEAVELFQHAHDSNTPYDLILMDIMMPQVNGLLSVQTIREKEMSMNISIIQRVKIIMTTELDDPRIFMKALYEADANSYLLKPIMFEKLEDVLRTLKLI